MKRISLILAIIIAGLITSTTSAQVTIGSTISPKAGALLDLKQFESESGDATANKGLMLPRLELTDLTSLKDIAEAKQQDKLIYTGLIVYNVKERIDPCSVIPAGVYLWDGERWQSLGQEATGGNSNSADLNDLKALQDIKDRNPGNTVTWTIDLTSSTYTDPDSRLVFGEGECGKQRLTKLNVDENNLSNLDISKFDELLDLKASSNNLYDLNTAQNKKLLLLEANNNNLSRIDVSQNRDLKELAVNNNHFSDQNNLNLTQNFELERLEFSNNSLHSINISQNRKLVTLYCAHNILDALDVTQHAYLVDIDCSYNRLSSLNPSMSRSLHTLYCNNNLLAQLDIKNNSLLNKLNITNNEALLRTNGSTKVCQSTWNNWENNPNILPNRDHITYDKVNCN